MARKVNHSRPKTKKEACLWESPAQILKKMRETTERFKQELMTTGRMSLPNCRKDYDGRSVPVMEGNSKTGALRSLSLRPVLDCGNCRVCSGECYDLRHDVINNACLEYRCATSAIYQTDRERFWKEVGAQAMFTSLWRWFIGGDIPDADFFRHMVILAMKNPNCRFLCFTKMYGVVNEHIKECGELPENLHVIFSMWPGVEMDNPYDLPVSFPVYAEEDIEKDAGLAEFNDACPKFYWHCNDNCTECALRDQGCFKLGKGEAVGFNYH